MRTDGQNYTQNHIHADAAKRLTHVTVVGMSNNNAYVSESCEKIRILKQSILGYYKIRDRKSYITCLVGSTPDRQTVLRPGPPGIPI